jgi:hypothetical protein
LEFEDGMPGKDIFSFQLWGIVGKGIPDITKLFLE